MAATDCLLQHIRHALAQVGERKEPASHAALLAGADVVLNELMLRQQTPFYLDHLRSGLVLLAEGGRLTQCETPMIETPAPDESADRLRRCIDQLHTALLPIVAALDESRSARDKDFLVRLSRWESSLHQHSLEDASEARDDVPAGVTRGQLEAYLRRCKPDWPDVNVLRFEPLSGGFSKQTALFETEDARNGAQALVLRAAQPIDLLGYAGSDVRQEYAMIELMRRSGVPVAEPLWLEADESQLGTRFIISRRAVGRTRGGNLGSDEELTPAMLDSIFDTLIRLHGVRVDARDALARNSHLREWLPYETTSAATRYCVAEFLPRLVRATGAAMTPQLLRGLQWLERNVPRCDEPPVVVHIDYALNNLILDDRRVTAVLDWESSRLGDPADDLVWTQRNLSAYITMPDFLARYEAATGRHISAFRLAYFAVARCVQSAITCLSAKGWLERDARAQIHLGLLSYRYMAIFGAQIGPLIEAAEAER